MKHQISTSIVINKSVEQVWAAFINFDAYPSWNPFIKSIEGDISLESKIKVQLESMKFTPVIKAYQENQELTWLGHLLMPGIFDGRHSFQFTDNGDGTTTLLHKEDFSGLLVGLMKKKLDTEVKEGFASMNVKLKELVEKGNS